MKQSLLLPHRFKLIGWCILILAIAAYVAEVILPNVNLHMTVLNLTPGGLGTAGTTPAFTDEDVVLSLIGILAILGALMVGFSREKQEDEFIARLRLTSLQWAVLVNQLLLILALVLVWGMDFLQVMVYNMVTIPFIFIIRFNYILFRTAKLARREK